jgi:hypothetical protein
VFFGLWLLPLAYLVVKSGYFPNALGVVLVVGGIGYFVQLFVHFLTPDLDTSIGVYLTGLSGIAELVFVVWLLVSVHSRGVGARDGLRL